MYNLKRLYVDEYQDVNPAQALIQSMTTPECEITAVGDELQCIYNWRGSDLKRILTFDTDFENASKFYLIDNYRARKPIVKFANEFVSKNEPPEKLLAVIKSYKVSNKKTNCSISRTITFIVPLSRYFRHQRDYYSAEPKTLL